MGSRINMLLLLLHNPNETTNDHCMEKEAQQNNSSTLSYSNKSISFGCQLDWCRPVGDMSNTHRVIHLMISQLCPVLNNVNPLTYSASGGRITRRATKDAVALSNLLKTWDFLNCFMLKSHTHPNPIQREKILWSAKWCRRIRGPSVGKRPIHSTFRAI